MKMLETTFQSLVYVSLSGLHLLDNFSQVPSLLAI